MNTKTIYEPNGTTIDWFIQHLDCAEKSYYLTSKGIANDPYKIFADDINIRLEYIDSSLELWRRSFPNKYKYYDSVPIGYGANLERELSQWLSKGYDIIFSAPFDLIPIYCWYSPSANGTHTGHVAMISAEDEDNYYILDDPSVILAEEKMKDGKNLSRFAVMKKTLIGAFSKYAKLKAVKPITGINERIEENFSLERLLEKITEEFYAMPYGNSIGSSVGICAFEKMIAEAKKSTRNRQQILFMSNIYEQYLIRNRHEILLVLLKASGKYPKSAEQMETVLERWDMLRYYATKASEKKDTSENENIVRNLELLYKEEKKLMKLFLREVK